MNLSNKRHIPVDDSRLIESNVDEKAMKSKLKNNVPINGGECCLSLEELKKIPVKKRSSEEKR